ncbi:D123-domain-containing protein [Microstroma glucosiphilum]|uniref:D123-domain-containing protein n=1 Tax=Pseudomicrostroma glucosiphilum TaxID=1684307 RepID=A0A316UF91_9BASI|nr:D123-domain-containing protein [Pseudomicrostroma glucosiphilum]PWN23912.1 D123-domain-containing protein [Pseudomicrostroma glucosiphilum]
MTTSSSSASSSASSHPLPPLTPVAASLSACRFSSWYPPLRKVSPKATILDVSTIQPDFFEWLEEDGLILPRGSGAGVVGGEEEEDEEEVEDADGERDDASSSSSEDLQPRDFSVLDERIRQVINKYDGEVFPKLDWSAPRDAAWILPGQTLKCTTPADVYLLLKSSDFVGKDLLQRDEINGVNSSEAGGQGQDDLVEEVESLQLATAQIAPVASTNDLKLNLVLKRHFVVAPSHEFRCFVRAGQFVAICQRDGTYYDFLQADSTSRDIRLKLLNFWHENLKGVIGKQGGSAASDESGSTGGAGEGLQDYIWDAYFTRDRSRVFLMDVNPYLPRTDALSWDWDELEALATRAWKRDHPSSAVLLNGRASAVQRSSTEDEDEFRDEGEGEEDEDTGISSSDEDDGPPDPRGEPFIRIYTDGRPPTTHYRPWSPTSNPAPASLQMNDSSSASASSASAVQRRRHRLLPPLRLLTSQAQSSQSFPTYASNMIPRDVVDVSNGRGIEEFARAWKGEVEQAEEDE